MTTGFRSWVRQSLGNLPKTTRQLSSRARMGATPTKHQVKLSGGCRKSDWALQEEAVPATNGSRGRWSEWWDETWQPLGIFILEGSKQWWAPRRSSYHWIHGWRDGWNGPVEGWMNEQIDGWVGGGRLLRKTREIPWRNNLSRLSLHRAITQCPSDGANCPSGPGNGLSTFSPEHLNKHLDPAVGCRTLVVKEVGSTWKTGDEKRGRFGTFSPGEW